MPKVEIPKGIVSGMWLVVVVTLLTVIVGCAVPQNSLATNNFPLQEGFALGLNVSLAAVCLCISLFFIHSGVCLLHF